MVASNFKASLALVLQSEGGNDDDPADHGGRTSRGITQREYDAWRAENKKPLMDVWSASQADINAIYREEYWDPFCDGLPKGLDYLYFDMAVNAGPNRAAILLQRALKVTDDGRIGPVTRQAIAKANPAQLVTDFSAQKEAFYRSLHQPKFLKGWLNRVAFTKQSAIKMFAAA
jgi:lysozyme family protein